MPTLIGSETMPFISLLPIFSLSMTRFVITGFGDNIISEAKYIMDDIDAINVEMILTSSDMKVSSRDLADGIRDGVDFSHTVEDAGGPARAVCEFQSCVD